MALATGLNGERSGLCAGLSGVKACPEFSAVNAALDYVTIPKNCFVICVSCVGRHVYNMALSTSLAYFHCTVLRFQLTVITNILMSAVL